MKDHERCFLKSYVDRKLKMVDNEIVYRERNFGILILTIRKKKKRREKWGRPTNFCYETNNVISKEG